MVKLENVLLGLKKSLPERHHKLIPMNEAAIKKRHGDYNQCANVPIKVLS